jgi:phage terminase large subunit-like protein
MKPGLSRAERVIVFCESLKITSGMHAGRKLKLRPWQRAIVQAIYRTDDDGHRVVRTALLIFPRKQGKSALASALALCHLVGPESEPRGQGVSAAADRNQAAIVFKELVAMILADDALAGRCNIIRHAKQIEDLETGSTYEALASDAHRVHGPSPSVVIADELAQWKGRELYDALATSQGARGEPLLIAISTQSADPYSVMAELVRYGEQVDEGAIEDPTFHATIYAAPAESNPWDEATWHACNPALGDFRSLVDMRSLAARARRTPALEASFRLLCLNQPIDLQAALFAPADWMACAGAVDAEALKERPCWGGLDLSSTTDMTALVLYFPDNGGSVLAWFWLPDHQIAEREERQRVPCREWRDRGLVTFTTGRAIDKRAIVMQLAEIAADYDLQGLAFDRWRMADLKKLLDDDGIELPMVDFGQGFVSMGPAVDALETIILDGKLRHGAHPVLRWHARNTVAEIDPSGSRKPSKSKSASRIDGIVALVMAGGCTHDSPRR